MPDVSMVQQAVITRKSTEKPYCNGTATGTTFLAPLDHEHMPLLTTTTAQALHLRGTTFTPHVRIQTQAVQTIRTSGTVSSVFDCPVTPFHDLTPRLDDHHVYPKKANSSPARQPIKTPVMHPNLVCTLKSILNSPNLESDSITSSGSDSRCSSPIPDHQTMSDQVLQGYSFGEDTLRGPDDSSSKAGSPENTSKLQRVPAKCKLLQQEAVLVSVDLIQNRRPYQCAFTGCQRTFKNPQTMRMHHKTHFTDAATAAAAGIQLGSDHQVSALLMAPGSLKAGNNKKIPSRCPTCYKTFVGLYELRRHFGRKHSEGEKRHACRKCGKRFHIEVDVRDHEKLCGEPIACTCGMKFAFKCNLVAHKRSHPKCQNPQETNCTSPLENNDSQSGKRRKLRESDSVMLERSRRNGVVGATTSVVPASKSLSTSTSSSSAPVQPFALIVDSGSSLSPFSSTTTTTTSTSSPCSSFVAEALPEFDVTSCSSSLEHIIYHYSSSSSCLADISYIKGTFPGLDHDYFLAYQAVPQSEPAQ